MKLLSWFWSSKYGIGNLDVNGLHFVQSLFCSDATVLVYAARVETKLNRNCFPRREHFNRNCHPSSVNESQSNTSRACNVHTFNAFQAQRNTCSTRCGMWQFGLSWTKRQPTLVLVAGWRFKRKCFCLQAHSKQRRQAKKIIFASTCHNYRNHLHQGFRLCVRALHFGSRF